MKAIILTLLTLSVAPLAAGSHPSDTKDQKKQENKQLSMGEARENSLENREDRAGNRGNDQREQNLDQRQDNIENR